MNIAGNRGFILMTIGKDTMIVNGQVAEIDPGRGTAPLIENGRTLVPIRAIVEAMGGTAEWDAATSKVTISALNHNVEMQVGSKNIAVDGGTASMDIAPEIINGRTMLPIRFVTENIGCSVAWIASTQEVVIVYPLA